MVEEMNIEPFSVFGQNSAYNLYAEAKVYVRPDMGEGGITISNVESSGDFNVAFGNIIDLPAKAVVTYNDGSKDNVAHDITWDIDPQIFFTPGTYTILGEVSVPSYVGATTAKAQATLTIESTDDPILLVLADILNDVRSEDVSGYTAASVAALNEAIDAVQAIFGNRDAYTDAQIIDLVDALIGALQGLVEKPVKDQLGATIGLAKAIDADKLITSVKENLLEAIADAEDVYADDDATQEEVDDAFLALVAAMAETGQLKGDVWGKLEALESIVKSYQAAIYTPASFAVFSAALTKARDMIADKDSYTQTKIDAAYDGLYAAWRALVRAANFSALSAVIGVAESIVANIDDYTPASVEGLAAELDAAKLVFADKDSTQAVVNGAAAALTAKVVLARLKEDKSKLNSTYTKAKSINTAGYTPYSVATLNAALNYAETIIDAPEGSYTQAQVDAADTGIDKAVKSLIWIGTSSEKAPSDNSAPDEAIGDAATDNASDTSSGGDAGDAGSAAAAGGGDSPAAVAADGGVIVADAGDAAQAGAAGSVADIAASDTPLASGDGAASVINAGAAPSEDGSAGSVPTAVYILIGLLACALIGSLIVMVRRRRGQSE
jgi:hypothetical protein